MERFRVLFNNKYDMPPIEENVTVKINHDRMRIYLIGTWHKSTFFIQRHSTASGYKIFDCSDSVSHKGCSIEFTETKRDSSMRIEYSDLTRIKFNK